ncbi:PIN domain-containing protein [Actinophytocola sp. KF-1]
MTVLSRGLTVVRLTTCSSTVAELLAEEFQDRILPFGVHAAAHYADIVALRERQGKPISMAEAQIAAICRRHDAQLVTRNVEDFADTGVTLHDPWDAGS